MQAIKGSGINWIKVDQRELNGYSFGDEISLNLNKKGCGDFPFLPNNIELCEDTLIIEIDINKCISEGGRYNLQIINAAQEIIYQNFVQIYN